MSYIARNATPEAIIGKKGIVAYDVPERVARYDADMDVMHPLRHKMMDVALEVLPFDESDSLRALDVGTGTGKFAERFLERFPNATVLAVDGAASMIELASARLEHVQDRIRFVTADFRQLADAVDSTDLDVVFSAYALHHLNQVDKRSVCCAICELLRPDGWFVNADLVTAEDPAGERLAQDLRVNGIVQRADGKDGRFRDVAATRSYLDGLEEKEGDQPLKLEEDLRLVREAGLRWVEVFWKEYREVVFGGPTQGSVHDAT